MSIRDPSDGSVKEIPVVRKSLTAATGKESLQVPVIDTTTSGLQTGSGKPENLARLEKSREWLRNYRAGKTNSKSEGN